MDKFQYYLPTKIIFERGSLSRIGEIVSQHGKKCFLMTMGDFATKYGYTEFILDRIGNYDIPVYLYDEVEISPSENGLKKVTELFVDSGCDLIVAYGGGSVIDTAKAVSVVAKLGGKIGDYYFPDVVDREIYPIIAVPTTCGTGSEVTKFAIITEDSTGRKKTVMGDTLIPRLALLDADTLQHLPRGLIASTGADVFCHAIESFTSSKRSPISNLYAAETFRVAYANVVKAYNGDESAKEQMFYASLMGGAAINTAGTTAAHALGYYISSKYHIPHGVATIMFLPHLLKYELNDIRDKLQELAYLTRFEKADSEYFITKLCETVDQIGIAKGLKDLGVSEEDKENIVQEALTFRRNLENNPVKLERKDLMEIVEDTYAGR